MSVSRAKADCQRYPRAWDLGAVIFGSLEGLA